MIIKDKISHERFLKFSKREQLGAVSAEIERAKIWQKKDKNDFLSAIERLIDMIDGMISDLRWKNQLTMLFGFRDEAAKFYAGINQGDIEILGRAL